jgi:cytochrome P450
MNRLQAGEGEGRQSSTKSSSSRATPPTAIQRVQRAQLTLQNGNTTWVTTSNETAGAAEGNYHYVVDRATAEHLLAGTNTTKTDEEEEEGLSSTPTLRVGLTSDTSFLCKPNKPNPLLQNALTNVNLVDWKRQRPLVQRAMGHRAARQQAAYTAREAALEFVTTKQIDARAMGLHVAIETMTVVIFSSHFADRVKCHFKKNLYLPTLLPNPSRASSRLELDGTVEEILSELKMKTATLEGNDGNPATTTFSCLAVSLLEMEESTSQETHRETLTRPEVISNCFSALLAGIQTIATTLTGSLAHLAELNEDYGMPDYEGDDEKKRKRIAKLVCNETLRILPPVASLPRCPKVGGKKHESVAPKTVNVRANEIMLMDLLAFAHAQDHQHQDNQSWKFCCPATSRGNAGAAPFGLGERRCPAGALSVEAITAVLEGLMGAYSWTLVNPVKDSVGSTGKEGWVGRASYQPTLVYPDAILLSFEEKKDV